MNDGFVSVDFTKEDVRVLAFNGFIYKGIVITIIGAQNEK